MIGAQQSANTTENTQWWSVSFRDHRDKFKFTAEVQGNTSEEAFAAAEDLYPGYETLTACQIDCPTVPEKPFTIGSIQFAAVRAIVPRPHWRLRIIETGEVLQPGTGGISNVSVPKMMADIDDLFSRVSKGDVVDFRRRFGLNIKVKTCLGEEWILEPVSLQRLPSLNTHDKRRFIKSHIPWTSLGEPEQNRLLRFMQEHKTECFSCRGQFVTLSGGMLAQCDPEPFQHGRPAASIPDHPPA